MNSRMSFFPHTAFGIWSDILIVAYILFFILADAVIGSGPDYNVVKAIIFTVIGGLIAAASPGDRGHQHLEEE